MRFCRSLAPAGGRERGQNGGGSPKATGFCRRNTNHVSCGRAYVANPHPLALITVVLISPYYKDDDMPAVRIRWGSSRESRLGRLAMDVASSVSLPLPPLPLQISGLVLESVMISK